MAELCRECSVTVGSWGCSGVSECVCNEESRNKKEVTLASYSTSDFSVQSELLLAEPYHLLQIRYNLTLFWGKPVY